VLPLYVASLLVGLGVLAVQLAVGHDSGGGHEVHHGDAGHELTPLTVIASVRFWAFALLAFGLVGTLLTGFGFAAGLVAFSIAAVSGGASGLFAVTVVSRLLNRSPQSMASSGDALGQVGRVVVPITPEGPGKVRVEVKGNVVDLIARAREALETGAPVVVEEITSDGEAQVSRAPKELAP
jgi:membrane protein implicated in regulation of membrane protease activity